ncbi:hypothetical protein [Pandoravirus japonicus]|uniref:Uncharacterized protein n=1 Tax=Pandoravirus japonicus TaxID=2823154 RepID=A0A811BPU1_9VIRU|nr:hypothetical protein [Pandoravirus japonicus]
MSVGRAHATATIASGSFQSPFCSSCLFFCSRMPMCPLLARGADGDLGHAKASAPQGKEDRAHEFRLCAAGNPPFHPHWTSATTRLRVSFRSPFQGHCPQSRVLFSFLFFPHPNSCSTCVCVPPSPVPPTAIANNERSDAHETAEEKRAVNLSDRTSVPAVGRPAARKGSAEPLALHERATTATRPKEGAGKARQKKHKRRKNRPLCRA